MGINPADAVKMFMQGAQKQNPNLDITKYEKRYKEMLIKEKMDRIKEDF